MKWYDYLRPTHDAGVFWWGFFAARAIDATVPMRRDVPLWVPWAIAGIALVGMFCARERKA